MGNQNQSNTTQYKPGRELDALIAEKVFGIAFCTCCKWDCNDTYDGCYIKCDQCGNTVPYPATYSTNISESWEVLEKFKDFSIHSTSEPKYFCYLWNKTDQSWDDSMEMSKISVPHAICLAALRAVENS